MNKTTNTEGRQEGTTFDTHIENHISKMWGGLQMASIKRFVETGEVNGSFREALTLMMSDVILDYEEESAILLPNDKEVSAWFEDNIDKGCSASSGIYKFRLWLKERQKQYTTPSAPHTTVDELKKGLEGFKAGYNTCEQMRIEFMSSLLQLRSMLKMAGYTAGVETADYLLNKYEQK